MSAGTSFCGQFRLPSLRRSFCVMTLLLMGWLGTGSLMAYVLLEGIDFVFAKLNDPAISLS
jgi:hypothetical protein